MEMTSKEALERLNNFISREKHINSERNKIVNECLNTIKQDLERLEKLEKDNQKLKKAYISDNDTQFQEWCRRKNQELKEAYISVNEELHCAFARGIDSARFDVLEENAKLKKENQELKEEENRLCIEAGKLFYENAKLKKAIQILKDKRVSIDLLLNSSECCIYNFYAKKQDLEELTQQEYELLKEVLQ